MKKGVIILSVAVVIVIFSMYSIHTNMDFSKEQIEKLEGAEENSILIYEQVQEFLVRYSKYSSLPWFKESIDEIKALEESTEQEIIKKYTLLLEDTENDVLLAYEQVQEFSLKISTFPQLKDSIDELESLKEDIEKKIIKMSTIELEEIITEFSKLEKESFNFNNATKASFLKDKYRQKFLPYRHLVKENLNTVGSEYLDLQRTFKTLQKDADLKEFKTLIRYLDIDKDDFDDSKIWIQSKNVGTLWGYSGVMPYLGVTKNNVYMRLVYSYYKYSSRYHSWLFVEDYNINADGKIYRYKAPYDEVKRENGTNWISERCDKTTSNSDIAMLKKISDSKKVKMEMVGRDGYSLYELTGQNKLDMKRIIRVYELLKLYDDFKTYL